jgi:hypothetical protein
MLGSSKDLFLINLVARCANLLVLQQPWPELNAMIINVRNIKVIGKITNFTNIGQQNP